MKASSRAWVGRRSTGRRPRPDRSPAAPDLGVTRSVRRAADPRRSGRTTGDEDPGRAVEFLQDHLRAREHRLGTDAGHPPAPWIEVERAAGRQELVPVRTTELDDCPVLADVARPHDVTPPRARSNSSTVALAVPGSPTTSHSSGPSHSTPRVGSPATVFANDGNPSRSATSGAHRTSICVRNGTSTACNAARSTVRAANAERGSAIAPRPLDVVEDRVRDRARHRAIVEHGVDRATAALASTFDQRQRDAPARGLARVRRGDPAQHVRRRGRYLQCLDDLCSFRQYECSDPR